MGRKGRGCWDPPPPQVSPSCAPPLQGWRPPSPSVALPPPPPCLTAPSTAPRSLCALPPPPPSVQLRLRGGENSSGTPAPQRVVAPSCPREGAPAPYPQDWQLPHPSSCWGPWQHRAFWTLSPMGSCWPDGGGPGCWMGSPAPGPVGQRWGSMETGAFTSFVSRLSGARRPQAVLWAINTMPSAVWSPDPGPERGSWSSPCASRTAVPPQAGEIPGRWPCCSSCSAGGN